MFNYNLGMHTLIKHAEISNIELTRLIRSKKIRFGGNLKLKIYGTLHCKSGKRMKRENRAFFSTAKEAENHGYRPCGHCMKGDYLIWKNGSIQ